jgi:hypothetical protein
LSLCGFQQGWEENESNLIKLFPHFCNNYGFKWVQVLKFSPEKLMPSTERMSVARLRNEHDPASKSDNKNIFRKKYEYESQKDK